MVDIVNVKQYNYIDEEHSASNEQRRSRMVRNHNEPQKPTRSLAMTEPQPNQNGVTPISSRKMVRFPINVPVKIALQHIGGMRVEGRYGDRFKYTLADERTMYVGPSVAERIRELDIQPGELFQVCKQQSRTGNRNTIHWAVGRTEELDSQLERDLRASLERARALGTVWQAAKSPSSSAAISGSPSSPIRERGLSNPTGKILKDQAGPIGLEKTPPTPSRPSVSEETVQPPDTQLAHALKTAIAAAVDAERFAKTLDYSVRFTADDIRSMGITVLIGMQQRIPR